MLSGLAIAALSLSLASQASADGSYRNGDVELHYKVYGDRGPYAVILAGGPGGANWMLQPIADALKDRFRCVMLEQRGTGRSRLYRYDENTISFDAYIGDVEELRKHLGPERLLVVGSSWGMTLAYAYAGAHPDHVLGVATLGSGSLTEQSMRVWDRNFQARLTPDQKERLKSLSEISDPDEGYAKWFHIVAPAYFYDPAAAEKFSRQVKAGDLNGRVPGPANRMMLRLEEYVYDRLDRIKCPVLALQGRQDLAPLDTVYAIAKRIPTARVVVVEKCGHIPWLDQPQATWKALNEFVAPLAKQK